MRRDAESERARRERTLSELCAPERRVVKDLEILGHLKELIVACRGNRVSQEGQRRYRASLGPTSDEDKKLVVRTPFDGLDSSVYDSNNLHLLQNTVPQPDRVSFELQGEVRSSKKRKRSSSPSLLLHPSSR